MKNSQNNSFQQAEEQIEERKQDDSVQDTTLAKAGLSNRSSEITEASSSNLLIKKSSSDPSSNSLKTGERGTTGNPKLKPSVVSEEEPQNGQEEESKEEEQNKVDTRKKAAYKLAIHQLDVGQGDSALILFKKLNTESYQVYKSMLIDGGRSYDNYNKNSIKEYVAWKLNGGESSLDEYTDKVKQLSEKINKLRIDMLSESTQDREEKKRQELQQKKQELADITQKLDAIVLSHNEEDHNGGLPGKGSSVVDKEKTKYISHAILSSEDYAQCEVGGEKETWRTLFGAEYAERAEVEQRPSIECVSSGAHGKLDKKGKDHNNNSLAFVIRNYGFSFFTAGDLGGAEETLAVQKATKAFTKEATKKALDEIRHNNKSVEKAVGSVVDEAATLVHNETGKKEVSRLNSTAAKKKLKALVTEKETKESLQELLKEELANITDLSSDQYDLAIKTLDAKYPGISVMKTCHHGSGGASSTPALKNLNSVVALNSNGQGHEHPHAKMLERAEKYITHTYMTNPPKTLEKYKIKFIKDRGNKFTIAGDSEIALDGDTIKGTKKKAKKEIKGHLVVETREDLESAQKGSFTVSYQQKVDPNPVQQCRDYYHGGGLDKVKDSIIRLASFKFITTSCYTIKWRRSLEYICKAANLGSEKDITKIKFNHKNKTFAALIGKEKYNEKLLPNDIEDVCYINAKIQKDMITISIKNAKYGSITKEYTAIQKDGYPNITLLSRRVISRPGR